MMDKIEEECNLFIDECPNDLLYDYGFNCIIDPYKVGFKSMGRIVIDYSLYLN